MRFNEYDRAPAEGSRFDRTDVAISPVADAVASSVSASQKAAGEKILRLTHATVGNAQCCAKSRREERVAPSAVGLNIISDPYHMITALGGERSWRLTWSAEAFGDTDDEANARLARLSWRHAEHTVRLSGPGLYDWNGWSAGLVANGPAAAELTVYAPFCRVEARDFAGPIHIAAPHARAKVLNSSGEVEVSAGDVDFAGSRGRVILTAEVEVNLRMDDVTFAGTLVAWAQRSVRLLVPHGFCTPIRVMVNDRAGCVCRTEFGSRCHIVKQAGAYMFCYGCDESAARPSSLLELRSEQTTVVIDHIGEE